MTILFHRSVIGYQERTLHRRFGFAYAGNVRRSTGLAAPPGLDASGLTMVYLPGKLLL
jgi:hypothetical protein